MMLLEFSGVLCAVGLDWEVSFVGEFSKKQLIKRGRSLSASHFVAHVPQEQTKPTRAYGFGKLPKLNAQERKQGAYSLASVIARDRSDSFCVVIPMGIDAAGIKQLAFVGILEGQPATGFDLVGNEDFIKSKAQTFLDQNGIGRYYFLSDFGDPELNLSGKTSAAFVPATGETVKVDPVSKLLPLPSNAILLVALAGLILAGGLLTALIWHKEQENLKERLARGRVTPEMAYVVTRNNAFKGEANAPANRAYPQLASLIFKLPVSLNGWALDKVTCAAVIGDVATFSCPVTWSPRGGTYESFRSPIPEAKVTYDANLSLVTMKQDVRLPDVAILQISHYPSFPDSLAFVKGIGSVFQDLTEIGFKVGLSRLQSVGNIGGDAKYSSALYRIEWSLNGPIDQMEKAMLALPPSMTLSKVELVMPPKGSTGVEVPRISTSGVAYVR